MMFGKRLWKFFPILILLLSSVVLVYSTTLSPLAGAEVDVDGDNGEGVATTASDGTFSVSELGAGNYTVEISCAGYISKKLSFVINASVETNLGDIKLDVSGKIQGVVQSPDGNPVANIMVLLIDQSKNDTVSIAITSNEGVFVFDTNVKSGMYSVEALAFGVSNSSGYSGYSSNKVVGISATEGQTTSGVVLQLKASGKISGTVKDKSGNPITNVTIWALAGSLTQDVGGFATTDSEGRYVIDSNLPTGVFKVYILDANGFIYDFLTDSKDVSVTAGQETVVNFILDRSEAISGTVTLTEGAPVADVTVFAISLDGKYYGSAETDINGNYRIETGLGTGFYQVMVDLEMKMVEVKSGVERSNVNFQITRNLAWITGMVTNSTSPLDFAHLNAVGEDILEYGFTGEDGKYTLVIELSLDQDSAKVIVTSSAKGYFSSSKNITVNSGETTNPVDFSLQRMPSGSLRGRVVAADVSP